MNKTKVIILLLFLFISLVFALEWRLIIEAVDKAYRIVGLKTPSYILTIIEKESGFGSNLGYNLGSKEKNLKRCIDMCRKSLIYTECYSVEARTQWCNIQYSTLEQITSNLGLDINEMPFSDDFGIGYTQFQPTTWLQYKELRNKNPWNLEDSLYAAAIKLKYDGVHDDPLKAVKRYNSDKEYIRDYFDKLDVWNQILDDTIFVYDCPSNNFSCALSVIKTNYPECTENDWSIKKKKECIKTKVALQKEQKLAQKQNEAKILAYEIQILETKESTPPYIEKAQNLLSNLIDLFTGKQTSSINNQNNQTNSQQTSLNEQNIQQTNQQSKINEQKQEEITYKEEKKEIIIERKVSENINTTAQALTLTITSTPKTTSTSTTSITSTLTQHQFYENSAGLRQQIVPTSTEISRPLIYAAGGGISLTQSSPKDLCDDYSAKSALSPNQSAFPKIIINEIQFETASDTKDEFIELYNPNNEEVDLTCWKLEKYASKQNPTSTPTLTTLIPSSKFQGKIKPNGYFLITSSSTKEKYQGDLAYAESYSIANNNVIILRKPNGEISDLVGYGDDTQKIYQFENSPFTFENNVRKVCVESENVCIYKSIQRKNFQDTDDNSKDFWLHKPSPKNSNFIELPREDFIDLSEITIQNFDVKVSTSSDSKSFMISFSISTTSASSSNYYLEIKISTSTQLFDLSILNYPTSVFPLDFNQNDYLFNIPFENCLGSNIKFFVFVKDNLDEENEIGTSTEIFLDDNLCSQRLISQCQVIDHSQDNFENAKKEGKILISKVKVISGVNKNKGEFIELYNPNDFPVNISNWYIKKITSEGNFSETNIVAPTKLKAVIQPFSYFLITNKETCSLFNISSDYEYPTSSPYGLTYDNGIALFNPNNQLVDYLCWGKVDNFNNCLENPPDNKIIERKKFEKQELFSSEDLNNYGHGYIAFDDDYNYIVKNTFIFSESEPYNSQISKPVPKSITKPTLNLIASTTILTIFSYDNQIKETKEINFHEFDFNLNWFSPAFYETSSMFYILNNSLLDEVKFKPLAYNSFKIDLKPFDVFLSLTYSANLSLYQTLLNGDSPVEEKEISSSSLSYSFERNSYNNNPEISFKDIKFYEDENENVKKVIFTNISDNYEIINLKVIEKRYEVSGFDNMKIRVKKIENDDVIEEKILGLKYKEIGRTICNGEYNFVYYEAYKDKSNNYSLEANATYEFEIIEPDAKYFFKKCEGNDYIFKIYGGNMIFLE
jgi:hypothetical protein